MSGAFLPPTVSHALPPDRDAIMAILEESRQWIAGRGIRQWISPFADAWVDAKIASGEFWIARRGAEPVAVVRLLWTDRVFWGARDDGAAAYVHSLAVRRACAGQGLGAWILGWAEEQTLVAGRRALRLDCEAHNDRLCAYYELAGFAPAGTARIGQTTIMLFEKALAP